MSTLNKLRKAIQEEIKKTLNESGDPKSARNDAFELTKQARSVAGYKAKISAYEKALAAHQKAASLMKSPLDKKQHLLAAKKLQTDIERFKADMNFGDGAFRSDMKDFGKLKNESFRDDELKRLKIQNKDVDLNLTLAGVQGELAYENGKLRVPGEDKELMNNLDMAVGDIKNDSSEKSKYRKQLLQAWLDGYDAKKEDLESYDESWMEDPKDLDESKNEEGNMTTKKSKKLNLSDLRKIIKEELSEAKPTHYDGIRIPDAADLSNKAIELLNQSLKASEEAVTALLTSSKEASRQGDTEESTRLLKLAYVHKDTVESLRERVATFKKID